MCLLFFRLKADSRIGWPNKVLNVLEFFIFSLKKKTIQFPLSFNV